MSEITIRYATVADASRLLEIYAPYVENTAITYEYEVPSIQEFERRIHETLQAFPYLVAIVDGNVAGYAYVSKFHPRAAYQWDVETSIYVEQNGKKHGIGRTLYAALEEILREMNIFNLYACIATPTVPDEHLDYNSVEFHRHLGYEQVAEFRRCAYKFDQWYNMVWMERRIGEYGQPPEPVKSFMEVRNLPQLSKYLLQ